MFLLDNLAMNKNSYQDPPQSSAEPAPTTETVAHPNVQTIGIQNFSIFSTSQQQGLWRLHFIWGKKDFCLFLQPQESVRQSNSLAVLGNNDKLLLTVTRLQYLRGFQWYDYHKVSLHNLAYEEICWKLEGLKHYVELPKDFLDMAIELACRAFDLRRISTDTS